ncbi:MAG: hypothetical protein J6U64_06085 [Alphaproteobacteria bacterium]|nr:hypothetical protein [Alphaproteobacteria bacterium]
MSISDRKERCFYHGSATKIQGEFLQPKEQFNSAQDRRVLGAFVASDIEHAKFFALWKCLTGNGQTRQETDEKTGAKKIFFERLSNHIKPKFYLYTVHEPPETHFVHDRETEYYSTKPVKISERQICDTVEELNKLGYEIYVLNKPMKSKPCNRAENNVNVRFEMQQAITNGDYQQVDIADLIKKQQSRNVFQKMFGRQKD